LKFLTNESFNLSLRYLFSTINCLHDSGLSLYDYVQPWNLERIFLFWSKIIIRKITMNITGYIRSNMLCR
jgi:hypothetical protein